jgi:hypothetical protein
MNRIQFFVLVGLSSLLVLLMVGHLYLARKVGIQQSTASALQQAFAQGKDIYQKLTLLARRINAEAQKSPPDQAMKDILTHEQITLKNPDTGTNGVETPIPPSAPPSSTSPATTH